MEQYYMPQASSRQLMSRQYYPFPLELLDFSFHSVTLLSLEKGLSLGRLLFRERRLFLEGRSFLVPRFPLVRVHFTEKSRVDIPFALLLIVFLFQYSNILEFKDYKIAFSELYTSNSKVLNRMRLTCQSIVPSSLVIPTNIPRTSLNGISGETTCGTGMGIP